MDAIDILGELLGHKTKKSSRGTDVLKDIFQRGSRQSNSSPPKTHAEIKSEAEELEELLNVANKSSSTQNTHPTPQQRTTSPAPAPRPGRNRDSDNERAVVLVRAMVNAAKADGRLDDDEQKKIFEHIGSKSRANLDFLRKEFSAPLNVQEFARSVPVGMEQQVYTISLIAIDLDSGSEADYLLELAQTLRIPTDVREQIHQRLGAASIY